jgi:hypothetical protein
VSQSQPTLPEPVPPAPVAPAAPAGPEPGFFDTLLNLFVEPRTAFAAILRRPERFWIPLLGCVLLNIVFTTIWMQKVDARVFMRNQIEESGRADKIPADRMDDIIDKQARMMKFISPVSAVLAPTLIVVVLGALFLFVFRFFYGGEIGFVQSMAVVAWSSFAVALVSIPVLLAVYAGKGDWNLNPQSVVQANLSLLLDKETTSRPLYSLAESFDLFTAWMMFLLASGYGLASRKPALAALWGILIPWALYVLGKVGLVALMS